MKYIHTTLTATSLIIVGTLQGLTLEVQKMEDGQPLPLGYQLLTEGINAAEVINLSAVPYVDYLVPNNSGSAGITAQKEGGQFITSSSAADMGGNMGGASLPDLNGPDKWHVVFAWEDGTPLPFGSDFYGVSWANWSAETVATLNTRIDLASSEEVTVYHWFNDGWNYADGGHTLLAGHVLTVTQFKADGTEVDSKSMTIPSGGAESFFGDHRMFASSIITATATATGDYLILTNEGGNIGYKGTAVALLGGGGASWLGYDVDANGWANTGDWLGWVNVNADPYIWVDALGRYGYIGDASGWVFMTK